MGQSLSVALGGSQRMLEEDIKTWGFLFEAMCHRNLQIYAKANKGGMLHTDAKMAYMWCR